MKARQLIGVKTLREAIKLSEKRIPIATVVRVLGLEDSMHYRTAFNIIKADIAGHSQATRPDWLTDTPKVQTAPDGWFLLNGMTEQGSWEYVSQEAK